MHRFVSNYFASKTQRQFKNMRKQMGMYFNGKVQAMKTQET